MPAFTHIHFPRLSGTNLLSSGSADVCCPAQHDNPTSWMGQLGLVFQLFRLRGTCVCTGSYQLLTGRPRWILYAEGFPLPPSTFPHGSREMNLWCSPLHANITSFLPPVWRPGALLYVSLLPLCTKWRFQCTLTTPETLWVKPAKGSRGALWPSRLCPVPGPSLTQGVSLLPCSQVSAMRPVTVQSEQSCLMCSSCSRVTPSVSATGWNFNNSDSTGTQQSSLWASLLTGWSKLRTVPGVSWQYGDTRRVMSELLISLAGWG